MARFEMGAADIAAMAPANATGESYYELGLMYASGRSVPLDLVAAHKWLNVAVVKGFRDAVQRRAELAAEMSAAEIATAQREARLWLTRHGNGSSHDQGGRGRSRRVHRAPARVDPRPRVGRNPLPNVGGA